MDSYLFETYGTKYVGNKHVVTPLDLWNLKHRRTYLHLTWCVSVLFLWCNVVVLPRTHAGLYTTAFQFKNPRMKGLGYVHIHVYIYIFMCLHVYIYIYIKPFWSRVKQICLNFNAQSKTHCFPGRLSCTSTSFCPGRLRPQWTGGRWVGGYQLMDEWWMEGWTHDIPIAFIRLLYLPTCTNKIM